MEQSGRSLWDGKSKYIYYVPKQDLLHTHLEALFDRSWNSMNQKRKLGSQFAESIHHNQKSRPGFLPGPLPKSMSKKDVDALKKTEYRFLEKSEGERCMMWCIPKAIMPSKFHSGARRSYCFLVNRLKDFWLVDSGILEAFGVKGETLIDGEMAEEYMYDTNTKQMAFCNLVYKMFDAVKLNDSVWAHEPRYSSRIKAIEEFVVTYLRRTTYSTKPFRVQLKSIYTSVELPNVIRRILKIEPDVNQINHYKQKLLNPSTGQHHQVSLELDSPEYHQLVKYYYNELNETTNDQKYIVSKNDGIVAVPEDDTYFSEGSSLFKVKWPLYNTVDLLIDTVNVNITNEVFTYDCFARSGREDSVKVCNITLHNDLSKVYWTGIFNFLTSQAVKKIVVECTYDLEQNTFQFLRVRPDKDMPNHINTVHSTIATVRDNVTVNDIVTLWNGSDTSGFVSRDVMTI